MPTTDRNYMNVLWGKLASEILMQDWDNALDDLNRLREVLDSNVHIFLFYAIDLCYFHFRIISYNINAFNVELLVNQSTFSRLIIKAVV